MENNTWHSWVERVRLEAIAEHRHHLPLQVRLPPQVVERVETRHPTSPAPRLLPVNEPVAAVRLRELALALGRVARAVFRRVRHR